MTTDHASGQSDWFSAGQGRAADGNGVPGTQKNVYTARLANLLEVKHISMVASCGRSSTLNPSSTGRLQCKERREPCTEQCSFGLLTRRLKEGY
ncbi:hypothetical protein AAC387_Pa10g0793 [Persea americana]